MAIGREPRRFSRRSICASSLCSNDCPNQNGPLRNSKGATEDGKGPVPKTRLEHSVKRERNSIAENGQCFSCQTSGKPGGRRICPETNLPQPSRRRRFPFCEFRLGANDGARALGANDHAAAGAGAAPATGSTCTTPRSPNPQHCLPPPFLDTFLLRLIRRHLVELNDSEAASLFEPDRPLGTFSSRIQLARALGIFGPKTSHDLNKIREIRNAFAHGLRKMDFDTPEIKQLMTTLHCVKDIENYKGLSSRELFFEITAMLSTHLDQKVISSPAKRATTKLAVFCSHLD